MTTQAVTSGPFAAASADEMPNGKPSASPPPAAAAPTTKDRRFILGIKFMTSSSRAGGGVNGLAHLLEGAAAADIGDRFVDVFVGRLRLFLQQCRDRHDHSGLTVTALRHVVVDPGFLHLMQRAVLRQTFDG